VPTKVITIRELERLYGAPSKAAIVKEINYKTLPGIHRKGTICILTVHPAAILLAFFGSGPENGNYPRSVR
jgi:hypothetical protein